MEVLFDGIPLDGIRHVRTTANSIGQLWLALNVALAEKKGHVFFQAEDGIQDWSVTGVQTCALPISTRGPGGAQPGPRVGRVWRRGSALARSEERRVGKECRCRWSSDHQKKKGVRLSSSVRARAHIAEIQSGSSRATVHGSTEVDGAA